MAKNEKQADAPKARPGEDPALERALNVVRNGGSVAYNGVICNTVDKVYTAAGKSRGAADKRSEGRAALAHADRLESEAKNARNRGNALIAAADGEEPGKRAAAAAGHPKPTMPAPATLAHSKRRGTEGSGLALGQEPDKGGKAAAGAEGGDELKELKGRRWGDESLTLRKFDAYETAEDIAAAGIPGVGPATAQQIVEARNRIATLEGGKA
jgi:hypothetical protein